MTKHHEATAGRMTRMTELSDGDEIKHDYRRGVTGVILIRDGDYMVKWSDRGGNWEKLHAGDFGGMA